MKDKPEDVSKLMSNLSLRNNLDQEEDDDEEVVESLVIVEQAEENEGDEYISKGPVRGNNHHQARANPYQMPQIYSKNAALDYNVGRFIDDETEMEFILSRMELPNTPTHEREDEKQSMSAAAVKDFENGIPSLPKMQDRQAKFKPVILMQDIDADYQVLDLGLMVILDKNIKKVGIWIPETPLEERMKVDNACLTADIYIQLNGPNKVRLVNYMAQIKKDPSSGLFMLKKQFVHLAPMNHAGSTDLTYDIDPMELQKAIGLVKSKNVIDLLKSYGPNEESLLMTFCCQKNDSTFLRAQIFAFLSRVLSESNQEAIKMIIKKNQVGLSALDYATMANNPKIAAFLANILYIFGQDVLGKDSEGNTILHMMARKGDVVAPTMDTLMSVSYRDHNDNKRVYPTDVKNSKHEMPIHIVAMNKKCAQHIVQLLVKDCPIGLRSQTADGSLPIHLACQYSSDPTLLVNFLYYDKSVVNFERADGFTPLHLVAARADMQDVPLGLIRLDEDTQVKMIKILLDHGANKKATVEDLYHPVDLLSHDRARAKDYLKLNRATKKNCSSSSSSNNGSPTPPSALNPLLDDMAYSMMTPSPEGASVSNDPCMQYGGCHSPATSYASSYQAEVPSPNMYNIGSVTSNYTGSDADSDSDNCSADKLGTAGGNQDSNVLDEDFDFIAKVLYNHPTIQAVMANNL